MKEGKKLELILNRDDMCIKDYEGLNKIKIENSRANPTMDIEFLEAHPYLESESIPSHIIYEKKLFNTRISYQRLLTSKSGMDTTFNINPNGTITDGYIDFYTIKKSTSKRNGFYRLEFINGSFELYAYTNRKREFRRCISSYKIEGKLTPEVITIVISRMINIIEQNSKKHNKQAITNKSTNFLTIEGLLNLERAFIEKIKKLSTSETLSPEEIGALKNFIEKYEDREREQIQKAEAEVFKRVKEKKTQAQN